MHPIWSGTKCHNKPVSESFPERFPSLAPATESADIMLHQNNNCAGLLHNDSPGSKLGWILSFCHVFTESSVSYIKAVIPINIFKTLKYFSSHFIRIIGLCFLVNMWRMATVFAACKCIHPKLWDTYMEYCSNLGSVYRFKRQLSNKQKNVFVY